jgi:protein-tyrosine phosphatase
MREEHVQMMSFPATAQNFRSLGGIAAGGGKRIREGVLFRSGDIGALTADCRKRMGALGLRAMIDLRSVAERRKRPYDWGEADRLAIWGHAAEFSDSGLPELVSHAQGTSTQVEAAMMALYRNLPISHATSYTTLFHWLAEGRTPLLFSCAAGKDRTGVGAALVLWSLGVDRQLITADYLRSNESLATLKAIAVEHYNWDAESSQALAVLTADRCYLEAMFDQVEARWGTIERYLADMLDVDAHDLARLRDMVLEDDVQRDGG